MRILERYVTLEILKTFLFSLLVFTAIFFVGSLYTLFREDFSLRQIAQALPYALPYSLPFLVPIALLVGCALAYGRLAADNEVVPISTAGVHLGAIVAPAILLGAVLSALIFGLESTLIPYWNFQQRNLMRQFLESLLTLDEGRDKRISDERSFHLFARRYHGSTLEGVALVLTARGGEGGDALLAVPGDDAAGGGAPQVFEIYAERVLVEQDPVREAVILRLENATLTRFERPEKGAPPGARGAPQRTTAGEASIVIPFESKANRTRLSYRSSRALLAMRAQTLAYRDFAAGGGPLAEAPLSAAEMAGLFAAPGAGPAALGLALGRIGATQAGPAAVQDADRTLYKIGEEVHERTTLALAPFAFSLVAAAVPLLLRHNNRLVPFFIAFAIVGLTFFVPFLLARSLVDGKTVPVALAYYPSIGLTLATGGALLARLFRR
jgi:lipopolysaccharide export LptBFGC system permease protein LptF